MALPAHKPTIDTCHACGKLFPRTAMQLCTSCVVIDENRFRLVRDFLLENDGAALADIARSTGVSMSDVRRFSDSGRLIEISAGLDSCTCGGVGTRCRYCRSRLSSTFRDMEQTMQLEHAERARDPRRAHLRDASHDSRDEPGRTSYVKRIRRLGD